MSNTFCVLPWMHLATHPNGGVSLCCRSNHTDAVSWAKKPGTRTPALLSDSTLPEIANSETFVHVREAMLRGERPVECEGCWQDEDAGIRSKRQYENDRWRHLNIEPTATIEPDYRYVELRLGNVCNNACLTCNSYSSSKWYPDEKRISTKLSWFKLRPQENFKWFDNPDFYTELAEKSRNVEEIYINGGEPTLIAAHFDYLQRLIDMGTAANVHLVYSLNMMGIPERLVELWKSFKKVTVNASVDDLEGRNFYIRWPSNWENTAATMRLLNSIPNVEWHVTQTISILNIATMDHLGFWLNREYGKTPHHNYVLYPDYLSLAALTPAYKDWLKDEFSKKLNAQQYRDLVAKLEIQYDPELTVKAHQFITEVDASRGLDYRQYLPNLARVFHDLNRQYYLDTINTHFKWCKDSTVLEIGPYYGEHTRLIASHDPKSVTLVEYNQSAVETLQSEFNNYEVVYADVHDFLKTSRHFDVVVCCGVLYHLHSPIHLLELIVNRATPNTVILESVSPLDAICIDEEDNTPGMRYVDTEWKSAHCSFIPPFSVIIKAMESMGYSTVEHRTSGYAGVTSKEMVQTAVFIKK